MAVLLHMIAGLDILARFFSRLHAIARGVLAAYRLNIDYPAAPPVTREDQ